MADKKKSKFAVFEDHGVDLTGESGDQVYGRCPFTDKDNKFYINKKNLLWDSKTAGLSGNVNDFLRHMADRYVQGMTPALLRQLAEHRKLPIEAFITWGIGWNGRSYTIPVRDQRGRVVDIRRYALGGRVMSTAGVQTGLLGAEWLPKLPSASVYICEGEWDAVALRWLFGKLAVAGVVLALPGAGVFKPEWIPWVSGRRVHTLYDKDAAGEAGEHVAFTRLKNNTQKLTFTHWPPDLPDGFDVRDWVTQGALAAKKPKGAWRGLQSFFQDLPRQTMVKDADPTATVDPDVAHERGPEAVAPSKTTKWAKAPTLEQVYEEFKKWLYLDSTDAIAIMLASAVSQQIDGEPIWMFLVGPPGSAKTETLSTLSWVENAYMTSSLTPHSLISGASWKDNQDPSLIPKLNGKIMVIKDFTSILSMRDTEKDEIFGILRDAYDGKCGKEFGNGVVRNYESRFTILAAVTPSIYALSSSHTALGERFLKFGIGDNLLHRSEDAIIERAISNINQETEMRDQLADVINAFLVKRLKIKKIVTDALPAIPDDIRKRIIALARFGARMRGSVTRDTYRNDIITSRPSAEVGSRLGKQLAKLVQALAVVHQRSTVTVEDYRLAKKVMLDTIPQRTEDILRHLLLTCPKVTDTMTTNDIHAKSRYPVATVARIMQDLSILDIARRVITKTGTNAGNVTAWTLSEYIRDVITKAGLYKTEEELNRPARLSVRIIKRRKKRTP